MSVTINPQINTQNPYKAGEKGASQPPVTEHAQNQNTQKKLLKPTVLLASTTGTIATLCYIAKKQNIKLVNKTKFSDIFKPKNWNIMDIKYDAKEIFQIASASTAGGLLAGLALDWQNRKYKIRESIQQMVGNLLVPIGMTASAAKLFDKYDHKINIQNPRTKTLVKTGGSLAALTAGMFIGNRIANEINEHLLGAKESRQLQVSDLAGQVDDVCLAMLLVAPENKFLQKVAQIIPLALIVPGYETGVKKSKTNNQIQT